MKAAKTVLSLLLVLALLLTGTPVAQATTAAELPDEIFLTQEASGTCTLCAAAMMIRSCLYIHGNESWSSVTESSIRPSAWINGVGLKWNFKHYAENAEVEVGHRGVSGFTSDELKALLDEHPEGIVLYCGRIPHAVFLTHYEGDTFYCAETVRGYSGAHIPLEESWIGTKYGTQAECLRNATAYWYVSSYEGEEAEDCGCSEEYAGTYICTTATTDLMIRAGHGTSHTVVGSIPSGASVIVTKASGEGEGHWAHVYYDGISGYASMQYLARTAEEHDYESTVFEPTCEGEGYTLYVCVDCGHSRMASFVDPLGHNYGDWQVIKLSTATEPGEVARFCGRCGEKEAGEIPMVAEGTALANPFADVAENKYYYEPVLWAYYNSITSGRTETEFMPNETCTRAQIMTFLWAAAGRPEPEITENPFTDVSKSSYYYKAVLWAIENGITSGTSATTFSPDASCTRNQVVTFLWHFFDDPEPTIGNPFADVGAGSYYYKAVLWAYENGITSGRTETAFAPYDPCTRGQIVTFLYNALAEG